MGAIFDKDGDQSYKFINGVRVGKNSHRKWYVLANSGYNILMYPRPFFRSRAFAFFPSPVLAKKKKKII